MEKSPGTKRGPQSPRARASSATKGVERGSEASAKPKSKQSSRGSLKSEDKVEQQQDWEKAEGGLPLESSQSQKSHDPAAHKRRLFTSGSVGSSEGEIKGTAASGLSKKLPTKAERRALQEAQRKAKAERQIVSSKVGQAASKAGQSASKASQGASKTGQMSSKEDKASTGKTTSIAPGGSREGGGGGIDEQKLLLQPRTSHLSRSAMSKAHGLPGLRQVQHFAHLPQYERKTHVSNLLKDYQPPPCILKLGLQYSEEHICGSNARCIGMLAAFKKVIQDYSTPPQKELRRDLDSVIKPYINFLTQCRPLSVSMGNAIKHLKLKISQVPPETPENDAKRSLCEMIDGYIREKIELADKAISEFCGKVIEDGDVILVHAYSSVVQCCLIDAHKSGKKFRVVVVSSRPKMEGHECLRQLVAEGIKCSYIFINAVSYIMKEVSKVIFGAHALLANGYVMSRIGTSLIAMVAKSYNVPVLVCCETYKFSDRVQTDAFVTNELGDPNDLVPIHRRQGDFLRDWKSIEKLQLLNLVYDVTSPDLITMVITQLGNIPCSSVPVVLRISRTFEQM